LGLRVNSIFYFFLSIFTAVQRGLEVMLKPGVWFKLAAYVEKGGRGTAVIY
jgi:hypothetical protein